MELEGWLRIGGGCAVTVANGGESDIKINGVIPPVIDVTVAIIPFVNSRQTLSSGQI